MNEQKLKYELIGKKVLQLILIDINTTKGKSYSRVVADYTAEWHSKAAQESLTYDLGVEYMDNGFNAAKDLYLK